MQVTIKYTVATLPEHSGDDWNEHTEYRTYEVDKPLISSLCYGCGFHEHGQYPECFKICDTAKRKMKELNINDISELESRGF